MRFRQWLKHKYVVNLHSLKNYKVPKLELTLVGWAPTT